MMPKIIPEAEKIRRARVEFAKKTRGIPQRPYIYGQHKYDGGYFMTNGIAMIYTDEQMEDIEDGGIITDRFDPTKLIPDERDIKEMCFIDLEELEKTYKLNKAKDRAVVNLIKIKDGFLDVKLFLDTARCIDAEEVCVYRDPYRELGIHVLEGRYGKALVCPVHMGIYGIKYNVVEVA